jgi:hypothetical protein
MLKIVRTKEFVDWKEREIYISTLNAMMIAEASCMKQNSKALPHFIAIVKELENQLDFHFEIMEEN